MFVGDFDDGLRHRHYGGIRKWVRMFCYRWVMGGLWVHVLHGEQCWVCVCVCMRYSGKVSVFLFVVSSVLDGHTVATRSFITLGTHLDDPIRM